MKKTYHGTVVGASAGVRCSTVITVRHYDHDNGLYRQATFSVPEHKQPRVGSEVTITIESSST